MSGLKTLFDKQKESKIAFKNIESKSVQNFSTDEVSSDYIEQYQNSINLYLQDVNFATASNFAKFGSARKYYENITTRITNYFPYDGSKAEQLEFENNLNPFEKYIYLYEYPRSTGYLNFSPNGWGSSAGSQTEGYGLANNTEYVTFYNQNDNNVYDPDNGLRENLRFIFNSGSTVEFWLKKDNSPNRTTQTAKEVIFYTSTTGSSNKDKRVILYVSGATGKQGSIFTEYYTDTETKFSFEFDTGLATVVDSTWHHYALCYYRGTGGYNVDFYFDGVYKSTLTSSTTNEDITGSMFSTIGSAGGKISGSSNLLGYGKLSGSIDEFRFWNTKRDAKQIGLNYFVNVGGGNDKANTTDLGIYYKFNEGILGDSSTDQVVLDYAGRNCNGVFINYSSANRSTGSAITDTQENPEVGTPILYYNNSDVQSFLDEKLLSADEYDFNNNFSLKNSIPSWILDEDESNGGVLLNFLQTISSYLDTLHLQITTYKNVKNKEYLNYKGKAPPFSDLLLTSNGFDLPALFLNTDVVQSLLNQDSKKTYNEKINDLKNIIYKNIYNNINIIYKSKGTENAIKQLIKNFGVDENVFSLNIYADNTQYQLEDSYTNKSLKKDYIDFTPFSSSVNSQAVIYQSGSNSFITGTNNPLVPFTLETDVIIPKFPHLYDKLAYQTLTYNTSSLFGVRTANNIENDLTVPSGDNAGLKVKFVYRDDKGYFTLTCQTASITLTSSVFDNITDDQHWNISVKLVPVHTASSYNLVFSGYSNFVSDQFREFSVSSSLTYNQGYGLINNNKRVYIGAERTNITGALVYNSLMKALSVRYWADELSEEELKEHAKDPFNYGRKNPLEPYHLSTGSYLPKSESLVLSWDFSNINSTDSNGNIDIIYDISSGSVFPNNTISTLIGKVYGGTGYGFIQNSSVKNKEYVYSSEQQLPENLYSSQLINILDTDDDYYTSNIRPQKYFFALENSMYDVISKNMLEMFATISEFNNFIGDPTNIYKAQYSKLKYFRKLFFDKVQNEPDLDKYVEIYKWVDDALDSVLYNLLPASANASQKVRTVIENHLLERNKAYYPITPENNVSVDGAKEIGSNDPPPGSPDGSEPNPAPDPGKSPKGKRSSLDPTEKIRYTFTADYEPPTGDHREKFLDRHESRPTNYDSVSYFYPRTTATGIQRTKQFVHRSNKYNITHRDIEKNLENRGYQDLNYINSSDSNALDKWYRLEATRDDQNLFVSSSNNVSRIQINDAVSRYFINNETRYTSIFADKQQEYHSGYNFNKEKLALFVEEHLLRNPEQFFEFIQDPDTIILNITGLNVKNIVVYENSKAETNTTLPGEKTETGEFIGHHKDGLFEYGLQGSFTEQHVGGYKHRHIKVGNNTDRPERFKIEKSGSLYRFKSPLSSSSGLDYNIPYSRFSRGGFTKSVVNIKNIPFTNSFGGNFSHNYELLNSFSRRDQNLAFVDRPNNFVQITSSSPYISGNVEYQLPDRRLANNTYNETVFVHKFGAPGDVNSTNPEFMDISEEFTPYNTVNYRNATPRYYLKRFLSSPSYFGGYKSASYGISASFQKQNRNNRKVLVSGTSNYKLRPDNAFINYSIPATDGGYRWVKNYAANTSSEGLYVNGIDNSILFVSKSADNYYFSPISASYITLSTSSIVLDATENLVLRKYLLQYNNLWNFNTKQQLSYKDNIWVRNNKEQNYYSDTIYDPNNNSRIQRIIRFRDSFIKDKHKNIINVYTDDVGNEENISIPFGEGIQSIASDFYRADYDRNINIYSDDKNIRNANKKNTLYFKLINFDRYAKSNNLKTKKIKKILHQEKIYPRSQNAYRDFARVRNNYTQKWSDSLDNRLTEFTNSQGQVFVGGVNTINNYSGNEYKHSFWPLDAYSTTDPGIPGYVGVRDKSGELTQIDNSDFYTNYFSYNGLIVPSGSYFGARFSRNWNINRPANAVHEQAGRGPYHDSYEDYHSDIKLIGQGCSIVPEYRISTKLDDYYSGDIGFYDDQFNSLEITGTVIEDAAISISTSSAFIEQRLNSDYIELTNFFNEELPEYKLSTLKLKVKAVKKLLPYDEFYPQNRMIKLAQQFSSSYNGLFDIGGSEATFRTALTPFYAPGIGFNSVKAGISMPFSIAYSSSANVYNDLTSSWSSASAYFYKMPWESILYPYKNLLTVQKVAGQSVPRIYDVDYNMRLNSTASIKNPDTDFSISFDRTYDFIANNFYSEVINFFKNKSRLTNIETIPDSEWYFPDLTKKYSLDIFINKSGDYTTYSGLEGYGTKPYHFHLPPWHRVAPGTSFDSTSNLDEDLPPSNAYFQLQASARIIFDPGLISSSSPQYFAGGKFTFEDIKKYSTVEYSSYIIQQSNPNSDSVVNVGDLMEIFSFSDSSRTWKPRVNWECPTADLNFYGVSAKLTNSSGNDSGDGSAGNAIRGIWHQYGAQTDNQTGLIINTKFVPNDRSLTGSLLDVVKFDTTKFGKVGETADFNEISEALIIIPFYVDECGSEKYFDINIDKFEELYENNTGVVGQLKNISRKYNLPPKLDYIRFRDLKAKRLQEREYGLVKSPFLMFAFEFSSILTKSDLLDIWQGVMPSVSTKAEVDYIEKEFYIGEYLEQLNYKLPDSTRFKVFKVKKRAITNYQQIIDKTNDKDYIDLNYGYNWPYDFCSLTEMVEVKAEMTYEYDIIKDAERINTETLSKNITSLSMDTTTSTTGGSSAAPTIERTSVLRTPSRTATTITDRVADRTTERGTIQRVSERDGTIVRDAVATRENTVVRDAVATRDNVGSLNPVLALLGGTTTGDNTATRDSTTRSSTTTRDSTSNTNPVLALLSDTTTSNSTSRETTNTITDANINNILNLLK